MGHSSQLSSYLPQTLLDTRLFLSKFKVMFPLPSGFSHLSSDCSLNHHLSFCPLLCSTEAVVSYFPELRKYPGFRDFASFSKELDKVPVGLPPRIVVQSLSCVWLGEPMDCSMPGFPVLHYLPELAQTHMHWVCDTIYRILCHPLPLLPSIFPSIRVFSNGLALLIRWQRIGASASVLPMNIQDWFTLRLTDFISLLSKGLSRVFSSTTVQNHQFFSAQPSLWSNSHISTWLLEEI